jgi:hypothetical protein
VLYVKFENFIAEVCEREREKERERVHGCARPKRNCGMPGRRSITQNHRNISIK